MRLIYQSYKTEESLMGLVSDNSQLVCDHAWQNLLWYYVATIRVPKKQAKIMSWWSFTPVYYVKIGVWTPTLTKLIYSNDGKFEKSCWSSALFHQPFNLLHPFMCMCVCVSSFMCLYMYLCVHLSLSLCVWSCVYCVYICVSPGMCICMCMCQCV